MGRKQILWVLLCMHALCSSSQETVQEASSLLFQGRAAAAQFRFGEALPFFYDCYQQNTQSPLCLEELARCHYQMGNYRDAGIYFHALANHESAQTTAWYYLGLLAEYEGQYSLAVEYYDRLVSQDKANAWYHKLSGKALMKIGDLTGALYRFHDACYLNPRDLESIEILAGIYFALEDQENTLATLDKGLALHNQFLPFLRLYMRTYHRANRYKDVLLTGDRLMALGDSTSYFMTLYAHAALQIDSLHIADNILATVCARKDAHELAFYYHAIVLEKMKRYDEALTQIQRAITKGTNTYMGSFLEQAATIHVQQKSYQQAIDNWQDAYRLKQDPIYLYRIAVIYDNWHKDKSSAIRYYERYLKSGQSAFAEYVSDRLRVLREHQHQGGK